IGEYSYQYGISTFLVFGIPFYLFALVFGALLAGKIREANSLTIPDRLYEQFGRNSGIFGSILIFVISSPAPYVLMVAVILQLIFGWSLAVAIIVGAVFSALYVYLGGFKAVVLTDKLQFLFMFGGFVLLLFFAASEHGGIGTLFSSLPEEHLTWHGGNSFGYIFVWFFIALWTMIDPAFHQRCAAAKSPAIAKKGIFISVAFWFLFDILTITSGLYARMLLPGIDPVQAYPLLAETLLPPVAKGLFFIGILSVIMSTVDSLTLISGATIGRDLIWRYRNNLTDNTAYYSKIGIFITLLLAIFIAYLIPSVIGIWYTLGSVLIPALLLPVMSTYFPRYRLNGRHTFVIMVMGFLLSFLQLTIGYMLGTLTEPEYLLGIEPIFPGLTVSFFLFLFFNLKNKT
ncbi:MAG: sodium:solute symporter family protein, partial [Candidatus Marinimicrobia bacterium]|nr:sodium:solute symporter family protein [Candidatus Neomarinimicrobiota bacterium]